MEFLLLTAAGNDVQNGKCSLLYEALGEGTIWLSSRNGGNEKIFHKFVNQPFTEHSKNSSFISAL